MRTRRFHDSVVRGLFSQPQTLSHSASRPLHLNNPQFSNLNDLGRSDLIDQVYIQEVLPPEG